MLSPERRRRAFRRFPFDRTRDDVMRAAMGVVALFLLVASAVWVAAHEEATLMLDFMGP